MAWAGPGLLTVLTLTCAGSASSSAPPRNAAPVAPDGGLPAPAPSTAKSVIVPSDTGLGRSPTGSGTSTGTDGRTMPPTLGNPGS